MKLHFFGDCSVRVKQSFLQFRISEKLSCTFILTLCCEEGLRLPHLSLLHACLEADKLSNFLFRKYFTSFWYIQRVSYIHCFWLAKKLFKWSHAWSFLIFITPFWGNNLKFKKFAMLIKLYLCNFEIQYSYITERVFCILQI